MAKSKGLEERYRGFTLKILQPKGCCFTYGDGLLVKAVLEPPPEKLVWRNQLSPSKKRENFATIEEAKAFIDEFLNSPCSKCYDRPKVVKPNKEREIVYHGETIFKETKGSRSIWRGEKRNFKTLKAAKQDVDKRRLGNARRIIL